MGPYQAGRFNADSAGGGGEDRDGICEVPTPFGLLAVVDYLSGGTADPESIRHITAAPRGWFALVSSDASTAFLVKAYSMPVVGRVNVQTCAHVGKRRITLNALRPVMPSGR